MKEDKIQSFIIGLKTVIKRDWKTQEAFAADGVSSKVHLSNIFNGHRTPSPVMRKALADRAGMSIEDIIAIGEGGTDKRSIASEPAAKSPSALDRAFPAEALSDLSSGELLREVNNYTQDVSEHLAAQAKSMATTIKTLADERNRLLRLWRREQVISNSLDEAIKVVTKKYDIGYCNRSYTEKYQQVEGDHCSKDNCVSCKGACLAGMVFATGKPEQSLVEDDGYWFYKKAYPIPSATGLVENVVVVSREIDSLLEMMREMGWEVNLKGKS